MKLRHAALHVGAPPPFWEDHPLLQMLKLIWIPAYFCFVFAFNLNIHILHWIVCREEKLVYCFLEFRLKCWSDYHENSVARCCFSHHMVDYPNKMFVQQADRSRSISLLETFKWWSIIVVTVYINFSMATEENQRLWITFNRHKHTVCLYLCQQMITKIKSLEASEQFCSILKCWFNVAY